MSRYVELRTMSWYSFMEGASSVDEMTARAQELGYDAIALTDRNNITGALEFSEAALALDVKPIIGATIALGEDATSDDPPSNITLIVENRRGYANLCNLISFAHIGSERTDPILRPRYIEGRTEGLIALIGEPGSNLATAASDGTMAKADDIVNRFIRWFGHANLFIELQRHFVHGDLERNRALASIAQRHGVGIVATGGVCYHERSRSRLHDVITAIRHNLTLDASHRQRKANSRYELKSPAQMERLFKAWPEAIENSRKIADRCMAFKAKQINYRFPNEPVPPEFENQQKYLEHLCYEAAKRRYGRITDKVQSRLDREFRLIERHGLAGFFLLYRRIIALAQDIAIELGHSSAEIPIEEKPPGRGRGSSVAMLVGTLIGLSHIDPLEYDLPLERFISEDELVNVPDIDLDFPRDIREALILRVYEEFGWDHAALTAMIPTYKLKGVVRDVGKALGLPPIELDILAKRAESHKASNIEAEMARIDELRNKIDRPGWRELIEIGNLMHGFPKGLAQHPGGMIISSSPLIDVTPVQQSAIDGRYICQWDKHGADAASFLKIDFLALGALSQMQECLQLIEKRTGSHIDLSRIDYYDDAVYDDLGHGDTVGVFQVESAAQMQTITRMKPRNLYDLALEVAAVRPGVGANDGVSEFIRRRNGNAWDYDHPLERRALEKSLGIILFQDQVVTLGMDVGGMTSTEADQMRRAFQRRNNEAIVKRYWEQFRDGAAERSVSEAIAEKIFRKFNPHYMFPEGHALAFGVTAYHMAWLRRHYPTEFYTSIFNAQPMGFWPLETLKQDAKHMGVELLGPDVNASQAKCVLESENSFRLGISFVHGLNTESTNTLIANREWNGTYTSLADLISRSGVQQRALENLVKAGACDKLPGVIDRRQALWEIGLRYGANGSQGTLDFGIEQDMATLKPIVTNDRMTYEYETLGLWTDGHVMSRMRDGLDESVLNSTQIDDKAHGQLVVVAGTVLRRQRPLGKMIFMTLEDEFGMIPLAVPPQTWEKYRNELRTPIVIAEGTVSRRSGTMNIMVNRAWPLNPSYTRGTNIRDFSKNFR